jgi:hypothetical protein
VIRIGWSFATTTAPVPNSAAADANTTILLHAIAISPVPASPREAIVQGTFLAKIVARAGIARGAMTSRRIGQPNRFAAAAGSREPRPAA